MSESLLEVKTDPEIIFIGAGINSLCAAFILAKEGWRVLVLDQNSSPGGAIRTLELTLPGFLHDIGAMNLSMFAGSEFYTEHREVLAEKGLEFIVAEHSFGSFAADDHFLGVSTDLDANLRSIACFSKADAEAWKDWREDYDRCSPILFQILGSPAVQAGPLELIFGRIGDIPASVSTPLRGILLDSLRANLGRRFQSDIVQALIAAWAMHLDYAPDISGGCWMPFLETNGDERKGIPIARGGSGNMIRAIVELVQEYGGNVAANQVVQEILFDKGRASGVRLASGQELRCSRGVVASVTPQALVRLTRGNLPDAIVKEAENYRYGPGTMVIHLALSRLPDWKDEAARQSFYVHIGPSLDYIAAAYQEGMAGMLPSHPFIVVGQPTIYDSARAPDGKHVLWIMVRAIPAEIRGDAGGQINEQIWKPDVAKKVADRVIRKISRYAPDLPDSILAMKIHTPLELQQLNPNLVNGDLSAGSLHLSQFYGNRPFVGYANHEMPIPGLYMCGASTWPGGGVAPGSGMLLASKLLCGNS
ncbi:phytoene desaturase family protein [Microbulbifer variabilis]|uniref:phytoene desaturase family protein n=1 Tax=Microbulbifer variabilis TaxID=266805 RepID=UPI001CFEEF40|nr:NAD(P)/FAD-dependent oxidoreductase [Microbulbifer variabilis]